MNDNIMSDSLDLEEVTITETDIANPLVWTTRTTERSTEPSNSTTQGSAARRGQNRSSPYPTPARPAIHRVPCPRRRRQVIDRDISSNDTISRSIEAHCTVDQLRRENQTTATKHVNGPSSSNSANSSSAESSIFYACRNQQPKSDLETCRQKIETITRENVDLKRKNERLTLENVNLKRNNQRLIQHIENLMQQRLTSGYNNH